MPVYFAPPQQRLGKARVVYRIRRELRLKTHGAAGLIYRPILSAAPGQPVGRIQLHTGEVVSIVMAMPLLSPRSTAARRRPAPFTQKWWS